MLHKFNAARGYRIPKHRHRMTNWAEYEEGLQRRDDLTLSISEEALQHALARLLLLRSHHSRTRWRTPRPSETL